MLILAIVLVAIAFMMYRLLKLQRKQAGVKGWVRDQDLDNRSRHVYRDRETGISSKPDIVEHNRVVEIKSSKAGNKAKYSDILQVAAQLISTGKKKAELAYADGKKFNFEKNGRVMQHAIKKVDEIARKMRWHLMTRIPPRGTPTPNKCNSCMYKGECPNAN
jgi:CRISPR/Cas system-associated exonuclease Cas4 (RecB family)